MFVCADVQCLRLWKSEADARMTAAPQLARLTDHELQGCPSEFAPPPPPALELHKCDSVLGIQTQHLMFAWQVPYRLNHLSSPDFFFF